MKNVSVIIPCYNCQTFIGETLESLSRQTYRDFEVLCINDGSKDDTLAALNDWSSRGTLDIRVIDKENGGVSSARNAGIEAAKGEYLLFLDADDLYHPEFIECLVGALTESGADTSYCLLDRNYDTVMTEHRDISYSLEGQSEAMHALLYRMAEIGFYCYLYKREVIDREGIRFDINTRRFEDREFNWKYLSHCERAAFVDAPLYFYRVNEASVTQSRKIQWRTDRLDAVIRVEKYLEARECPFLPELKSYLFPRVMWSMAKNYSLCGERALLKRLGEEYDVRACMKRTAKDKNKLVALASRLYLIHPSLFYHAVRLKK